MKRAVSFLLASILVFSLTVFADARLVGDVNGDGKVNSSDALDVLTYSVGKSKTINQKVADVNNDGNINSTDALIILKIAVGAYTGKLEVTDTPLDFNKEQIVEYYNSCLKNAYNQSRFTVTKTENVDVTLKNLTIDGKQSASVENLANKIIEGNKKDDTSSKKFTNKTAVVNTQERYILPANLTAEAVKDYEVKTSGKGYTISFTLNAETCDFKVKPPFNASCTFPLDFSEINLGSLGKVTYAQFYYPGTTLTATVDEKNRVAKTYVVMPLSVDNATIVESMSGQVICLDISGKWCCTNINKF